MPQDEMSLVRRAQRGDAAAFGELVLLHQRFAYNLALRAVGDPDEAGDVAQDALIRAWQGLGSFRGQSRFRTWLYRIVVNLCYNRCPRLQKEALAAPVEEDEVDSNRPAYTPHTYGPENQVEGKELRTLVHQHIERLPASYRMLVLLRFQQDMAYEEIAEVMSLPLGTVKTGIFRAKAMLREALVVHEEVLEWMN